MILKRAAAKMRMKAVTVCWTAWWSCVEETRRTRDAYARAAKWKYAAASGAFNTWHQMLLENKRNRNLLKKAGAKMKMRVATSAFNTWVEMVQEKLRIRGLLNRAAKKMKMRKASMVFNTWCEMVEERHREKNSMRRAAGKFKIVHYLVPSKHGRIMSRKRRDTVQF